MPRVILPSKLVAETLAQYFNFASYIEVGETISSAVTTATVYRGADLTPSGIISGAASISGTVVTQKFVAGVAGTIYVITCTATLSNGEIIALYGYLAVMDTII